MESRKQEEEDGVGWSSWRTRGERNWGSPKCIAYARVSADNGGSQRAERIVIRNMG